jgi:hypothetical protein
MTCSRLPYCDNVKALNFSYTSFILLIPYIIDINMTVVESAIWFGVLQYCGIWEMYTVFNFCGDKFLLESNAENVCHANEVLFNFLWAAIILADLWKGLTLVPFTARK